MGTAGFVAHTPSLASLGGVATGGEHASGRTLSRVGVVRATSRNGRAHIGSYTAGRVVDFGGVVCPGGGDPEDNSNGKWHEGKS